MWLLFAFIAVPLIEIALFIQVGGLIGLWPTLAIVVLTAFLGTWLVRSQGMRAMGDLRGRFERLDDPTEPLAHGAMILVSAVLLLTPGFFTDAVGFALLIPPVRDFILGQAKQRIKVARFEMGTRPPRAGTRNTIDGEYEDVTPDIDQNTQPGPKPGEDGASGWTRK
ncbi:MAG: FxsA family protein [Pseudomonadota bacterium]